MAVSLDALQRGISPAGVGLLIALFAVLPMLAAFLAGRLIDQVGSAWPLWIGSISIATGISLPALVPGLWSLYLAPPQIGLGFMLIQLSVQREIGALGEPGDRAANFGWLSMGSSVANFAGPLIAGVTIDLWGHRATFSLLAMLPIVSLAILASGRLILHAGRSAPETASGNGAFELLSHAPLRRLFLVNAFVAIGWDVHTTFVPIYGTQIGLGGAQIGAILASFATASFIIRFCIGWITRRWQEQSILLWAFASAAAIYFAMPQITHPVALMATSFVLGLGLGTGQPIVLSLLQLHAPAGRMGEVAGLRLSMIQSMAFSMPILFGLIGSSLGLVAVFWAAAVCMGLGGVTTRKRSS